MSISANYKSALGSLSATNPVADIDNVFLVPQGWAYRHFTKEDGSAFYDELLFAASVDPAEVPAGNELHAPSVVFATNTPGADESPLEAAGEGDFDLAGTDAVETELV